MTWCSEVGRLFFLLRIRACSGEVCFFLGCGACSSGLTLFFLPCHFIVQYGPCSGSTLWNLRHFVRSCLCPGSDFSWKSSYFSDCLGRSLTTARIVFWERTQRSLWTGWGSLLSWKTRSLSLTNFELPFRISSGELVMWSAGLSV